MKFNNLWDDLNWFNKSLTIVMIVVLICLAFTLLSVFANAQTCTIAPGGLMEVCDDVVMTHTGYKIFSLEKLDEWSKSNNLALNQNADNWKKQLSWFYDKTIIGGYHGSFSEQEAPI